MRMSSRRLWMYFVVPLLVMALLVTVTAGCGKKKTTVDTTKAPTIPPQETFVIDFSDFQSTPTASFSPDDGVPSMQLATFATLNSSSASTGPVAVPAALYSHANVGAAVLAVAYWNLVLTVNLALPVASFLESFNHTPTQQSDGSWVWTYTVTLLSGTYTAELHGAYVGDETHWDMYVSKADPNGYSKFLWYSGVANLPETQGTWTLEKSHEDPTDFVGIEWHRDTSTNTGDIKYTYIVPNDPKNGSYIEYGSTTDATYDRFYNLYGKVEDTLTQIQWNHTTKAGRIKSGNGDWRYWDGAPTYRDSTGTQST